MQPQIEVMSGANSWRFSLEAERTTVCKAAETADSGPELTGTKRGQLVASGGPYSSLL